MTESNSVRMLQGDASIIGIVVALDGKSSKFVVSDIDPTHGFAHHVYFVDRFTFDMQCQVSVARFSSSCIACNASGKCRWPRPKHRATQYAFTHTCTVLWQTGQCWPHKIDPIPVPPLNSNLPEVELLIAVGGGLVLILLACYGGVRAHRRPVSKTDTGPTPAHHATLGLGRGMAPVSIRWAKPHA